MQSNGVLSLTTLFTYLSLGTSRLPSKPNAKSGTVQYSSTTACRPVEQPDSPDFLALQYTVLDLVRNLTEKLGPRTMADVLGKLRLLLCT